MIVKHYVFCLLTSKFLQEYQENANMVIDDTNMKQVVYVYKCTGSVLTVKGKVNSIIIGLFS